MSLCRSARCCSGFPPRGCCRLVERRDRMSQLRLQQQVRAVPHAVEGGLLRARAERGERVQRRRDVARGEAHAEVANDLGQRGEVRLRDLDGEPHEG